MPWQTVLIFVLAAAAAFVLGMYVEFCSIYGELAPLCA